MEIRPYRARHYNVVRAWLESRGKTAPLACDMAPRGWLAFERGEHVAAIFVRKMEGVGVIDGLATNPMQPAAKRNEALNLLVDHALLWFREKADINRVLAWTLDASVLERARRVGFRETGEQVIAITL